MKARTAPEEETLEQGWRETPEEETRGRMTSQDSTSPENTRAHADVTEGYMGESSRD